MNKITFIGLMFACAAQSAVANTHVITNDSLTNPGTTTSKVVKLQCGKKQLITNVEPYPQGCKVIREHDLNPVPVEK